MIDKRSCLRFLVIALVVAILLIQPLSYSFSPFASRLSIILAFITLPLLGFICQIKQEYFGKETIYLILLAISILFFFWRTGCYLPAFEESKLISEQSLFVGQYASSGHIQFSSGHSYFFLQTMVLYFLNQVCALSFSLSFYLALLLELFLVWLVSVLFYKFIANTVYTFKKETFFIRILPVLISFFFIAFINTPRIDLALLLVPLLLYLLFSRGIKHINYFLSGVLLVVGITLGSATGTLFITFFFLLYCLFNKSTKLSVYFIIPLTYLIFCTYFYTTAIFSYVKNAWSGFTSFLQSSLMGEIPQRVIPWERGQGMMLPDTYILTAAYLSLMLLSSLLILILVFGRSIKKGVREASNSLYSASLACLSIFLLIAGVTYLGVSALPESTSSDIRVIVFVFMMIILPFIFCFKKSINIINSKKIVHLVIIILIFTASLQTIYSNTKSINDPVNAVEDNRVDAFSRLSAINLLYKSTPPDSILFLDYKLYIVAALLTNASAVSMLSSSSNFNADIIGVDFNGLKFGSLYISPHVYEIVKNQSEISHVVYSSGDILFIAKMK